MDDASVTNNHNCFDSSDEENEDIDPSPFKIDWLDLSVAGCREPLGISALPGCRFKETWRKLENDIGSIKSHEISEVFVLCSRGELTKYRVPWLLTEYTSADILVHHYPFPDGQTPSMGSLMKMCEEIKVNLMSEKRTLIHCYGGLGRSCLVAVCLLLWLDPSIDCDTAIQKLKQLRGPAAVQSVKQYNFIHDFREKLTEYEGRQTPSRSVSR